MKFLVAALLVLIGCSAAAQSTKYEGPDIASVDPELIQMEQATVPAFDVPPESAKVLVAVNSLPAAPSPMSLAASMRPIQAPGSKEFRAFRSDRLNRMLVATEFWARGLDAFSTNKRLNDPCGCYREGSHFFGLDMTPVMRSPAGAYAYSLGVASAYSFISAKLWNASEDRPRHARLLQRLSRALLIGDSSMEFRADIHNFTIPKPGPSKK